MAGKKTIKSALESMMFVWAEPLDVKEAAEVFNMDKKEIYPYFKGTAGGVRAGGAHRDREVNKSFQFVTREENIDYIELCTPVKHKKLSQSALEVLAIVAYKQPVTKGEIESIRGIRCDRVLGLGKKLVAEVRQIRCGGTPDFYGTTDRFLKQFRIQYAERTAGYC